MAVHTLSIYEHYACRRSGACCTAGWSIPVERELLPVLHADVLVPDADGACVHFDRQSRRCRVHRDLGENMLPGSCYQFPRRALIDDRGTFITLSNFCPTAAALLCDSKTPLAIVNRPPAFPESRVYEGLDARGHWPPLVRDGLLFDLQSYSSWEQFLVQMFALDRPVDDVLARMASAAERLRAWTPAGGPFDVWTTKTLRDAAAGSSSGVDGLNHYRRFATDAAYEALQRFVPDGLAAPAPNAPRTVPDGWWRDQARTVRHYLASKAFGSWAAYDARGVRTLIAELTVSAMVLRVECERASRARQALDRHVIFEAVRQSDRLLVHLVNRPRMTEWLGQVEAFAV